MRIFVTGATGYIGFSAAAALRRAGHYVIGLARTEAKARRLWANEIEPVIGSMEDPESYRAAAASCAIAIHAAVDYGGDTFGLDRKTVAALQATNPERLIYTSGVWVYGDTGRRAADESTAVNPPVRVVQRLDSERLLLDSTAVPGVVLRPGCVYGREGGMFGDWFAPLSERRAPTIVGDGTNRWALVNVDDLAQAYVLAAESSIRGEVLNVTDRSRETVTEMVAAASAAAGYRGAPSYLPRSEAAKTMGTFAECLTLDQQIDSSKAVRLLGWQPRHGGFSDQATIYYEAWRALQ